jgi:hypothetical protein
LYTSGLTRTISCPSPFTPASLNTMSCTFTPTCGAERPMPSVLWHETETVNQYLVRVNPSVQRSGLKQGPSNSKGVYIC